MTFGYTAVVVAVIILISTLVFNRTDEILKSKVSSMTSALNVQMKMNMDSYLDRLESIGTLVFSSKEVYEYSASDDPDDSYNAISTEDDISDELYSLCIMENFVDFCMVYSNNHTIGKISNGTNELFGSSIYTDFSAMINRAGTNDGWSAGYNNNFKRIYYVKRVNDNAILVTSFYTSELEDVFKHPGGIEDISVRLVDSNNNIIYSSLDNETGKQLENDISDRIQGQTSATIMDDDYLITVNLCGDDWKVICSVPTEIILKEKNEVQFYIILVAVALSVVAFLINILVSNRISSPVSDMVELLAKKAAMDQLTRLLNKKSYEELVSDTLQNAHTDDKYCMILFDIDNFKGLNDNFGHAAGDKVLAEVGNVMRKQFKASAYLGRLGGDEFSAFFELPKRLADDKEYVKARCAKLCEALRSTYTSGDKSYNVSVSAGASLFPENAGDFQELYTRADSALYISKRNGKNSFRLFGEESEGSKNET